ncbi:MAG TPA: LysE family transporter, partial [Paracoccaceae bacterium]|nr:LysE family transporter [Paracoccaceae bacterium]
HLGAPRSLSIRLAFAAWRGEETAEGAEAAGAPMWRHFRRGLVTNLLNPKAAVFFIAVQPAFLPPAPEIDRVLVFSAVFVAGSTTTPPSQPSPPAPRQPRGPRPPPAPATP